MRKSPSGMVEHETAHHLSRGGKAGGAGFRFSSTDFVENRTPFSAGEQITVVVQQWKNFSRRW